MQLGIYQLINRINGKFYIGSASNLKRREWNHFTKLNNKIHDNPKLQAAYNKYGPEAFVFIIAEYCEKDKLIEREQYWLDCTKACEIGYNILKIAGSSIGYKHSEEFKRKRSEAYKGRKITEEQKIKTSLALKGKKKSESHANNIALAKLGNKYNLGNQHTEEAKKKMSVNRKKNIDNSEMAFYGKQIIIGE